VDEDIHEGEVLVDGVRGDEAGEDEVLGEAEVMDGLLELRAERAVADEEESCIGEALDDIGSDGEEIVMAFKFEEARDGTDDEVGV
jgi:hypothetical protein